MPDLFALMIDVNFECRIFLLEAIQSTREIWGFNAFRFDGQRDNRFWDIHVRLRVKLVDR